MKEKKPMKIASPLILTIAFGGVLLSLASADASAPSGRYVIGGQAPHQTVLDTRTKLTWERNSTDLLTADGAKNRCASLAATTGGPAWRVPTLKELFTIMDYSVPQMVPQPRIDTQAFGSTPPGAYWTSTPDRNSTVQCLDIESSMIGCAGDLALSRCVR
jgi:hypothetical protein